MIGGAYGRVSAKYEKRSCPYMRYVYIFAMPSGWLLNSASFCLRLRLIRSGDHSWANIWEYVRQWTGYGHYIKLLIEGAEWRESLTEKAKAYVCDVRWSRFYTYRWEDRRVINEFLRGFWRFWADKNCFTNLDINRKLSGSKNLYWWVR